MSSLGFSSELSLGNQANESIINNNRRIRGENLGRIQQHQDDITNSKNAVANLGVGTAQTKDITELVVGQVASKGKDLQAFGKVIKSSPAIANSILNTSEDILFGGEADSAIARARYYNPSSLTGDAVDFLKGAKSVGTTVGERAGSVGKLGIASTGLTIGLGLMDAYDDISSHKIQGNNSAERVSNIAGMVSGGLEAAGTALDFTGVGAEAGVALNLLGGLVSLAGGVADVVGEEEEKTSAQAKVKSVTAQVPQQEKSQAIIAEGTSGAQVRSN